MGEGSVFFCCVAIFEATPDATYGEEGEVQVLFVSRSKDSCLVFGFRARWLFVVWLSGGTGPFRTLLGPSASGRDWALLDPSRYVWGRGWLAGKV